MSSEPLAQWHGRHVLGFQDCILKGILEADAKVQRLYVTEDRPFGQLVRVLARPGVQTELNRHEVVAIRGGTVGSHLDRAAADAKFGRGAVVPLSQAGFAAQLPILSEIAALRVPAPLVLLVEDRPGPGRVPVPGRSFRELNLCTLIPGAMHELIPTISSAIDASARLQQPVGVLMAPSICHGGGLIPVGPNREPHDAQGMLARARREPLSGGAAGSASEVFAAMELDRLEHIPNVGEMADVGLVAAGESVSALRMVLDQEGRRHRVPLLALRSLLPINESAVERLLERCRRVLVFEPGGSGLEWRVLQVAERMRRAARRPAEVLPGFPVGPTAPDTSQPSAFAQALRRLDGVVVNTSKQTMSEPPPRGSTVGVAGAKMVVLRALRTMPDGARLDDESADIFVTVGDDPNRFLERLRAHGEQPACFIGIDFDGALERLIRAGHGHLSVTRRTMQDLDRLSSDIALAGREGTLSVVLLSDEDPPRWDVEAARRRYRDLDRLGYATQRRIFLPLRSISALGQDAEALSERLISSRVETASQFEQEPRTPGTKIEFRPLVQLVRVRRKNSPPFLPGDLPEPSRPRLSDASVFRVHVAGTRGPRGGLICEVMARAAAADDLALRWIHESTACGPGWRAATQIVLSTASSEEGLSPRIPDGEADLLLGVEGAEAARGIFDNIASPDRTRAIVNGGALRGDGTDRPWGELIPSVEDLLERRTDLTLVDLATPARKIFGTDRAMDMMILGFAYQRGEIPLRGMPLQKALREVEREGFGRLEEAFLFGRSVACGGGEMESPESSARRQRIRLERALAKGGNWGNRVRQDIQRVNLAFRCTDTSDNPLADSARLLLLISIIRSHEWGRRSISRSFSDVLVSLAPILIERPERIPEVIQVLVRFLLPDDPIALATLGESLEHRLRLRQLLDVHSARGDSVERRYLTEIVVRFGDRQWRGRLRTGPGAARSLRAMRFLAPEWLRGTATDRERKVLVRELALRLCRREQLDADLSAFRMLAEVDDPRTLSPGLIRDWIRPNASIRV